ncbi:hypothetical protein Fmac_020995 [Flemingia macrophylla]|uniref:Uncharacterized protein n=1 Tax=Flemingia macrophylla TaxID=520843 RepID=A0ABD1LVK6_9FABA
MVLSQCPLLHLVELVECLHHGAQKEKPPMVDVMDAQFDKLTTKLDVFADYLGQGMTFGSIPIRKRTSNERKGKPPATSEGGARPRLPSIEDVLNQTRFFSQHDQMIKYGNEFYHKVVLAPKFMDFRYFATSGLYFHHHLEFQGLQHFVAVSSSYFKDFIKVFYSNLRVSETGYLYSEGRKLSGPDIPKDLQYDRDTTLSSMIRPEMSSNFAQLLQEDIFMLWAIKNNILINWPHHIMEHMIKCKDNWMPLPYTILITRIMSHYGHGKVNQDHGQNAEDEDQPMPEEHATDIRPQPSVQYDPQMLSQIWSDIQGLQEGLHNLDINVNSGIYGLQEGFNTLITNVNRGFNIVNTRIEDLEKRFNNFQQSFE